MHSLSIAATLAAVFAILLSYLVALRRANIVKLVGVASDNAIGLFRIVVFAIILANTLWENLPSTALVPDGLRTTNLATAVLPASFKHSAEMLSALRWATAGLALFAAIGLRTRFTVPLAAVGYLLLGGLIREVSVFFHNGLVLIYVAAVLSFFECDGLSVERLFNRKPNAVTAINGWCRYLCWTVIVLPYFAAGMTKIHSSPTWWYGDNMRKILEHDSSAMMSFNFGLGHLVSTAPNWLLSFMGIAAVGAELCAPMVLIFRRARLIVPPMLLAMHLGIFLLQGVLFYDLIALQCLLFAWPESTGTPAVCKRAQIAFCGIVVFFAAGQVMPYTKFPIDTAWGMYAYAGASGNVTYTTVLAHYKDGTIREAPFDKWVGAWADGRFKHVKGFEGSDGQLFYNTCFANGARVDGVEYFEVRSIERDDSGEHVTDTVEYYDESLATVLFGRK